MAGSPTVISLNATKTRLFSTDTSWPIERSSCTPQATHVQHSELKIPLRDIAKFDPDPGKAADWRNARLETYGPWHNTYLAIYFTLTALHALHVIGGALVIGYLWGPGSRMWHTDPERFTNRIEISGLFWHFVDLVWIFLFPVLYLL